MKLVYLIDYDLSVNSGVVQKIKEQAKQWKENGHTVFFVSTITMSVYNHKYELIYSLKKLDFNFGKVGTAIKLLYSSYYLSKLLNKIEIDMIYMRYRLYMPFFSNILKKYPVIMEINSDDILEYKISSKVKYIYNLLTRDLILKNVNAFVSVSNELKEKFLYLNKPITVIANGIDISCCNVHIPNNTKPVLVFIGTPNQPWHGLDKIEKIAQKLDWCQFHIIGTKGVSTDNVKYFGYLNQEKSLDIIKQSDIGIGTLSLYKTSLMEASPLKTRQYLACGLPLIYAYIDTDLKEDLTFALQLNNQENNIDIEKIENFIHRVWNNKNIRQEARQYAEDVLDYSIKEKKRLLFFKKVLDEF